MEQTAQNVTGFAIYLPYITSVICALISGIITYFMARKQTKADIEKIVKQAELNLESQKQLFQMEKEKMEIEHRHQLELLQKESENNLGASVTNTLISEAMKMPEVRQKISQGVRSGNKHSKR